MSGNVAALPQAGGLTTRDRSRLEGVDPRLVLVVELARRSVDFIVVEGVRTVQRQRELLAAKKTTTMRSKHLTGRAVDLAPLVGGTVTWDWPDYHRLAAAMKDAARKLSVSIEWGGDWRTFKDGPHFQLADEGARTPTSPKARPA